MMQVFEEWFRLFFHRRQLHIILILVNYYSGADHNKMLLNLLWPVFPSHDTFFRNGMKKSGNKNESRQALAAADMHPLPGPTAGKRTLHLLLILFVGLISYSNTFEAPFQFDDMRNIVNNPLIQQWGYFIHAPKAQDAIQAADFRMRTVGFLSFALNYRIHGLEVVGYHIVNLAIHLANSFLVYLLVLLTLRTPKMRAAQQPDSVREIGGLTDAHGIALFASLLFVSHPIQTQAVTYIVQRFASLATLFYLSSFVLYLGWRLRGESRKGSANCLTYLASLVCAVVAMKTKEAAFTLPIMLSLYELLFFYGKPARRILALIPFLLTCSIIPLSAMSSLPQKEMNLSGLMQKSRVLTEMSRTEYLFTQFTVVPLYIRLIFLPVGQNLDHDHPLYHSLLNSEVLLSLLFIALLIAAAGYSLVFSRSGDRRLRLIALGIFWFFLALLPESSIIPVVDVIYEHRVYLPSVGAFMAIAMALFVLAESARSRFARQSSLLRAERKKMQQRPKASVGWALSFSVVIAACTVTTYMRNGVWQSSLSLWEDVARKSPNKDRAQNTLGMVYLNEGMLEEARRAFERTIAINPKYWTAHFNLGVYYARTAQEVLSNTQSPIQATPLMDRAIESYQRALTLNPDSEIIRSALQNILDLRGRSAINN
jgi:protein O-mannosyl-transferase